jgi:hypothetical protein
VELADDLWLVDRPADGNVSGQNSTASDLDPVIVWR